MTAALLSGLWARISCRMQRRPQNRLHHGRGGEARMHSVHPWAVLWLVVLRTEDLAHYRERYQKEHAIITLAGTRWLLLRGG